MGPFHRGRTFFSGLTFQRQSIGMFSEQTGTSSLPFGSKRQLWITQGQGRNSFAGFLTITTRVLDRRKTCSSVCCLWATKSHGPSVKSHRKHAPTCSLAAGLGDVFTRSSKCRSPLYMILGSVRGELGQSCRHQLHHVCQQIVVPAPVVPRPPRSVRAQ